MNKIPGDSNSKRTGEGGARRTFQGLKKWFWQPRSQRRETLGTRLWFWFSLKTSTTGAVAVLFSALSPKKVSVSQCVALELVPRAGAYYKEPATPIISQYNGIFTDQSIFRYFFPRNRPFPVYRSTLRLA